MIGPIAVWRAKRRWNVDWFTAWTRLRVARRYQWPGYATCHATPLRGEGES